MLTRKHYEIIAKILRESPYDLCAPERLPTYAYSQGVDDTIELVSRELSRFFEKDNPAFDRAKFAEACGVKL